MLTAPISLLAAAAVGATLSPGQIAWYRQALDLSPTPQTYPANAGTSSYTPPVAYPSSTASYGAASSLSASLVTWKMLQQSDNLSFEQYANFLVAHPGWPGEARMRRIAEQQIQADVSSPDLVMTFLSRFPPTTGAGQLRYAEALYARGRSAEAQAAARAAWTSGQLNTIDEGRLQSRFMSGLTQADQDQRMEALLWFKNTGSAQRQLPLVSAARRPIFAARLAYQLRTPDAASQASALSPAAQNDAGYQIDRATWLRLTGQEGVARLELSQLHKLDAPAFNPTKYMEQRYSFAKASATDGQWAQAFGIASQLFEIYPAGTNIRALPFAQRDQYTNLSWLAGQAALQHLGRPADAITAFRAYADASQSTTSRAKGYYWAGRAALASGNASAAQDYFANAAAFPDKFYGQLALERLGKAVPPPPIVDDSVVPASERTAFENREIIRAARLLGQQGNWQDQTQFLRAIGNASDLSDNEHLLIAGLAKSINRPDLGVMAERAAKPESASDYVRSGFPVLPVPADIANNFSFIHGIIRQESQFDRQALSRTGARGIMQLMPGTAREQASALGLSYDPARLFNDPGYNMQLGSAYFGRIMDMFSGNYVLAIAAYNAGPGNVRKWINQFGDPRTGSIDPVDWVELIPFGETRGYVQNVLENTVVYDTINPARGSQPQTNRLSYYLGRRGTG